MSDVTGDYIETLVYATAIMTMEISEALDAGMPPNRLLIGVRGASMRQEVFERIVDMIVERKKAKVRESPEPPSVRPDS